jgi:hypothetical protein
MSSSKPYRSITLPYVYGRYDIQEAPDYYFNRRTVSWYFMGNINEPVYIKSENWPIVWYRDSYEEISTVEQLAQTMPISEFNRNAYRYLGMITKEGNFQPI